MPKAEEPTPCPTAWGRPSGLPTPFGLPPTDFTFSSQQLTNHTNLRRPTIGPWDDGETENLDFTTEFGASFRSAAPRRRKAPGRKSIAWRPEIQIREDEEIPAAPAPKIQPRRPRPSIQLSHDGSNQARRSSIFAQPAQRLPSVAESRRAARDSISIVPAPNAPDAINKFAEATASPKLKKAPRRRTIYVPSDDTTIMTIHPGAQGAATDVTMNIFAAPPERPMEKTQRAPAPPNVRPASRPRLSLAAAPKKAPLQATARATQAAPAAPDVAGRGGGKENVPPGCMAISDEKKWRKSLAPTAESKMAAVMEPHVASRQPSAQSEVKTRRVELTLRGHPPPHHGSSTLAPPAGITHCPQEPRGLPACVEDGGRSKPAREIALASLPSSAATGKLPSKLSVPTINLEQDLQTQYPVLRDDIIKAEMYEDHWLAYQETAIVQLLNGLFSSAKPGRHTRERAGGPGVRRRFVELYHEAPFPLLHKRLQASLLYGALSIPAESLFSCRRLKDDVGLKRKFLSLWLDTYDRGALQAAAEVVIGRELGARSDASSESAAKDPERLIKRETRALEVFLETFLVRNDDVVRVKTGVGSIGSIARGGPYRSATREREVELGGQHGSWRRTVLRSLMLILLLDQGKERGIIGGCLFLRTSPLKSSGSVINALRGLLLPSAGDVTRTLGHLGYEVTHTQHPLQEYQYPIENLATDLRDGVRLTRVVELLLYPASHPVREQDVTVAMPTGELLVTTPQHADEWVLSHHLRFPAMGRAQKVHNVQVALAALDGVARGTANMGGVTADDIVNGHREKTVGLLWGLVSRWGLGMLIDWNEVSGEIARLRGLARTKTGLQRTERGDANAPEDSDDSNGTEERLFQSRDGFPRYRSMLKAWASAIAELHGLTVNNLSTSFADGRVFECIVDEYATYFPSTSSGARGDGLETKLKRLGCSHYFAALLGRQVGHGRIYDQDFVVAGLAFMCSRLLHTSLQGRAVVTIQQAYRARLLRRDMHKRMVLMRLAYDCQTVVLTRDRVIGAATVIQQAWRRYSQRRVNWFDLI
ncbi:MAG: hypothetical protein M1838_004039 [Thelocarpon superellum]|nr:MAG: hypothetical protein M1838_004039 [Thelocarpon superellum]